MTTFRVGQRVRLVRYPGHGVNTWNLPIGSEGTVAGTESFPNPGFRPHGINDFSVTMDAVGFPNMASSSCFEPITDSNTLVSWESMRDLWVPEHLREAA